MAQYTNLTFAEFNPIIGSGLRGPYFGDNKEGTSRGASSGSSKTSIGGLDSAMVEQLYKHGLPSDVARFFEEAESAIVHAYDPKTGQPNLSAYKILITELAKITTSKELFNKAMDKARSNNSLGEWAITGLGQLVAIDAKGTLHTIDPQDFDSSKYRPLSNGELARLRALDARTAYDDNISSILANGTSMLEITKFIKESIPNLGKSEITLGMSLQELQNMMQSAQSLSSMLNVTNSTTTKSVSLANLAALALNAIQTLLPGNMQTLLGIKASMNGQTPQSFLMSYIGSMLSDVTLEKTSSKETAGSKAAGLNGSRKLPVMSQWYQGYGARELIVFLKGNVNALGVEANVMPITKGGNHVGFTTLKNISTADGAGAFNWSNVSVAGNMVPMSNLRQILVDGESLYKMELPIDPNAKVKGIIKPYFEILDLLEAAEKEIKLQHAENNPVKINEIYKSLQLPAKYVEGASVPTLTAEYATFGVLNGYANKNIFGIDDLTFDDLLVRKVTSKTTLAELKAAINSGSNEKDRVDLPTDGFFSFGKTTPAVFESCVFIPVRDNWFNVNAGNGTAPTELEAFVQIEPLNLQQLRLNSYNLGDMPE